MDSQPRYAVSGDRRHFMALVEEFVKDGGPSLGLAWGPATAKFFYGLFVSQATVCVICRDGFSLAGGPLPWDTPWGRTAYGYGTYARPARRGDGLALKMRQMVIERLKEQGYAAFMGSIDPTDERAIGSAARHGWRPLNLSGVALLDGPGEPAAK